MSQLTHSTAPQPSPEPPSSEPDRLIGESVVKQRFPVSRTTRWRLQNREQDPFPSPVAIGTRHLWSEREVSAWIARQLEARPSYDPSEAA